MQFLSGRDEETGVFYEFFYIEDTNHIICFKDGKQAYVLEIVRKGGDIHLVCECWGQVRWKYCRHEDFCIDEFNFSKVRKPRKFMDIVAEEYYRDWLILREGGYQWKIA